MIRNLYPAMHPAIRKWNPEQVPSVSNAARPGRLPRLATPLSGQADRRVAVAVIIQVGQAGRATTTTLQ